jgi:branched-chain amino acid transport system substrate-binding protein
MRIRNTKTAAAAALLLAMTACGSDDAGGGPSAQSGAGGLVGEGTGEDCQIEQAVPVGAALSITGAAAIYGEPQRKALELAVEELNAKGGVTYDLQIEDDTTDPRQGITVFEQFISQDDVSVIVGPTLSNTAKQTNPVAQEAQTPVLGVSNTAAGITEIGDYIFRDSLTEQAVIPQTIEAAKDKLGLQKVVVMYANDDAFTESGYQAFVAALKDSGIEVADTLTFSKSDTDFRALLTQAKRSQPDALVVSALIEAVVPLVTQARESGLDVPIIGGNGFNSPALLKDAGEAAEGVIVGAAWNSASDSPENAQFLEAYKTKYGAAPDQFAAQAYTGMKLIDRAVRAGCSGEREAIKENLAELEDVPTVLGEFSLTDSRDAEHPAVVQIVENGSFAVLE